MVLRGNLLAGEDEWEGREGACEAVENLHGKGVDNNGDCEACWNSQEGNYSMLKAYNTLSNCLVKNVDVVEYNPVVKYHLVETYDMVTQNDIMTENNMVKLVHKTFKGMVSLPVMHRDDVKFVKKSFEVMAALVLNPAVLFEIYSNVVIYLEKLYKVWQPLCLGVWWLLSPHRGYCLQWLMCVVEFAEGQVFQTTVVTVLLSCLVGFMAVSNMNPWRCGKKRTHVTSLEEEERQEIKLCLEETSWSQRFSSAVVHQLQQWSKMQCSKKNHQPDRGCNSCCFVCRADTRSSSKYDEPCNIEF